MEVFNDRQWTPNWIALTLSGVHCYELMDPAEYTRDSNALTSWLGSLVGRKQGEDLRTKVKLIAFINYGSLNRNKLLLNYALLVPTESYKYISHERYRCIEFTYLRTTQTSTYSTILNNYKKL